MTIRYDVDICDIVGHGYGAFWNSKKRYVICKGSRGSKKSKTTALWLIWHMFFEYDKSNALCVRKYQTTIRDSQFSDLKWAVNRLGLEPFFKFTTNPLEITNILTGQKILFRGLDDGLKVTSISVPTGVLNFVWIEEAYELTNEDDFNKLDMSIRGEMPEGYFKRIMLTFNPWSANCWIKKRFFDVPSDNVLTLTTTWQCNEWLDDSDRKLFEEMKINNPRRYRIEGEGEWGISEGLIYENVELKDFDVDEVRKIKDIKACYGLDFGYTDPNAFVACMVDTNSKTIYVFDEWYQRNVTNKIIAEKIKSMGYGSERIVCDSAEPKSIRELCDEGLRAEGSRKGRDSVNHGIQLIQNYKIIVHPKCKEFYREICNYCWEKDRNGYLTDKPDHEFSHCMDSLRYTVAKNILPEVFSFE
jgi:phage terminase large subunit